MTKLCGFIFECLRACTSAYRSFELAKSRITYQGFLTYNAINDMYVAKQYIFHLNRLLQQNAKFDLNRFRSIRLRLPISWELSK